MMLKDDDCLKNTEIMKFQDLITKVPIFTKEEQERMINTGEFEINVIDPVPFESKYDCITVVRMTKEDVSRKYGIQIK